MRTIFGEYARIAVLTIDGSMIKVVLRVALGIIVSLAAGQEIGRAAELEGIFGDDNRELFDETSAPELNAIGRLNIQGGSFCSAVLIAPAEILTAAHCIWDHTRATFFEADRLHFVPGYRRGRYLGHARGKAIETASGINFDPSGKPENLTQDWAVITLDLNLFHGSGIQPIALAGRQSLSRLDGNADLVRVGYGLDRPHLPVRVSPCRMRALIEQNKLLIHDCDVTKGDSGSPIMVKYDDKLLVIGVHSAIGNMGGEQVGIAVTIQRHLPTEVVNDLFGRATGRKGQ